MSKRKVGIRLYYAPEAITAAAEEHAARVAAEAIQTESIQVEAKPVTAISTKSDQPKAEVPVLGSTAAVSVNKQDLLLQALTVAHAQTALVDRIVQNIGRMG